MEDNDLSVFKSYLRRLLQDLKDILEAIPDIPENKEVRKKIQNLIDDTQSGIED